MDGREPPSDDAYGRVTNPGRFALLHETADRLVADLVDRYFVERDDQPELSERLAISAVRATCISPDADAAPVTVVWTSFPGLHVAFGDACIWSYPMCGCDACNDDPGDLAEELAADLAAVVRGDFIEYRNRRGEPGFQIIHRDDAGRLTGTRASTPSGRLVERRWLPWPTREARHHRVSRSGARRRTSLR